jgi:hypothetical protein
MAETRYVSTKAGRRVLTEDSTGDTTFTPSRTDDFMRFTGTVTVTLPASSRYLNHEFTIKNVGTEIITVDVDDDGTIDDETSIILLRMDSRTVIYDGTEWWIK